MSHPSWTPALHGSHRLALCRPWKWFRLRMMFLPMSASLQCLSLKSVLRTPVTLSVYGLFGLCIPSFYYASRNVFQPASHTAAFGMAFPSGWTDLGFCLPRQTKGNTSEEVSDEKMHHSLSFQELIYQNLLVTCQVKMTTILTFTIPVNTFYP